MGVLDFVMSAAIEEEERWKGVPQGTCPVQYICKGKSRP